MHHPSSIPTTLLSLIILTLAPTTTAQKAAQCFYPPNGQTFVPQPDDTPCNPRGENSVCCAPEDICLSNGLCWRADINRLHRGSCTDPTFSHPACTSICTGPNEHPLGFADVLECTPYANQNWYCGVGNSSKCNTDASFKLSDGFFADYRNATEGGGAGEKTVTVTAKVTEQGKGNGKECPLTATPVSAGEGASTTGLTGGVGDGTDVSSGGAVVTTTAGTTAEASGTANGTAAATHKPGNGAAGGWSRGGVVSGVILGSLSVLSVMLTL